MTRFNITLPSAFPKDLDMEDAYGLLSEKTELYYQYVKAGDKENANKTHALCNDIAAHYDLLFVINDDHTKARKRQNYEMLHAKLEQCMNLKKEIEYLVNQAVYTASPLGLTINKNNWESVYQQCKLYLSTPDTNVDHNINDWDDYEADKEQTKMIVDWFSSGCSSYEEDAEDFSQYPAQMAAQDNYDHYEDEYFYASNYSCPDH